MKKLIKENLGDILIIIGLFLLPFFTSFINRIAAGFVLAAVFIILGTLYIKSERR